MKVLIAEDSSTFRTQIRKALESVSGVTVVGSAHNGRIALEMCAQKSPDLVILDLNMPELDGLSTLRRLKETAPLVKAIIFAATGARSARDTIEALNLGAVDFVVKPQGDTISIDNALEQVRSQLVPRVEQFLGQTREAQPPPQSPPPPRPAATVAAPRQAQPERVTPRRLSAFAPAVVVVASSTGGPKALETFLGQLRGPPRVPVLIAQHMPETFTKYLSRRLAELTRLECREGINGEALVPGVIYVAPGNFHMRLFTSDGRVGIKLDQGPRVNNVRPAANLLFESAVETFGDRVMAFVLTGMGEDGRAGAQKIKEAGGGVMIQDRPSCVVWGMPAAVFHAGAYDAEGDLEACAQVLATMVNANRGGTH